MTRATRDTGNAPNDFPDFGGQSSVEQPTLGETTRIPHSGDLGWEYPATPQAGTLKDQAIDIRVPSDASSIAEAPTVAGKDNDRRFIGHAAASQTTETNTTAPTIVTEFETPTTKKENWWTPRKIGAAAVLAVVGITAGVLAWAKPGSSSEENKLSTAPVVAVSNSTPSETAIASGATSVTVTPSQEASVSSAPVATSETALPPSELFPLTVSGPAVAIGNLNFNGIKLPGIPVPIGGNTLSDALDTPGVTLLPQPGSMVDGYGEVSKDDLGKAVLEDLAAMYTIDPTNNSKFDRLLAQFTQDPEIAQSIIRGNMYFNEIAKAQGLDYNKYMISIFDTADSPVKFDEIAPGGIIGDVNKGTLYVRMVEIPFQTDVNGNVLTGSGDTVAWMSPRVNVPGEAQRYVLAFTAEDTTDISGNPSSLITTLSFGSVN